MTYEYILKRALSRISSNVDKRQGSVIFDAVAPACAELAQIYISLENVLEASFADTAPREYLILRAKETGIKPYDATFSVCRGIFNIEIPIGTRFNIDKINFKVTEKINDNEYKLQCETAGSEGNKHLGTLVPIDYIQGLSTAELTEVIIPGEDEESTEDFRQRYFEEVQSEAFGGNASSYKTWVKEMEGVGMAKAERGSKGGYVNVYITTPDLSAPSEELLKSIKEKLDPKEQEGLGAGIAPIGHIVTVKAAEAFNISVSVTLSLNEDYTIEGIKSTIMEKLKSYINNVNKKWENESIKIYSAQLLVEILNISGINNISLLTINGGSYINVPSNSLAEISSLEVK